MFLVPLSFEEPTSFFFYVLTDTFYRALRGGAVAAKFTILSLLCCTVLYCTSIYHTISYFVLLVVNTIVSAARRGCQCSVTIYVPGREISVTGNGVTTQ